MFVEAVWRRKRPHVLPNSAFLYIIIHTSGHCFLCIQLLPLKDCSFSHLFLCTFRKLFFILFFYRWYELEVSRTHESYRSLDLCWQSKLCSWRTSFVCSMCLCGSTLQGCAPPLCFSEEVAGTGQPRNEERLYSPRLDLERSFWKFARRFTCVSPSPLRTGWGGETPAHFKLAISRYMTLDDGDSWAFLSWAFS